MKNEIAISELTAGLVSLVDGILAATDDSRSTSTGKQNIHIVDALRLVRDRFNQLKLAADRGECSADNFEAGMNAIMAELRSRMG
jgi:hypothetical protein